MKINYLGWLFVVFGLSVLGLAQAQQGPPLERQSSLDWPMLPSRAAVQRMKAELVPPRTAAIHLQAKAVPLGADASQAGPARDNLVATLNLVPAMFARPTATDVDLSKPAFGVGVPRQLARIAL